MVLADEGERPLDGGEGALAPSHERLGRRGHGEGEDRRAAPRGGTLEHRRGLGEGVGGTAEAVEGDRPQRGELVAPSRVLDRPLGRADHPVDLDRPGHAPEEVGGAQQRHLGDLLAGLRPERGERLLDLAGPLLVHQRLGEEVAGPEAAAGVDPGPGEALAEGEVAGGEGAPGGVGERLRRRSLARLEPPGRDPEQVVLAARPGGRERPGELGPDPGEAQAAGPRADHLGVERMGEADAGAPALAGDREHPGGLGLGEDARGREPLQHLGPHRLAEGDRLEQPGLLGAEPAQPLLDHREQGAARRHRPAPAPDPLLGGEAAGGDPGVDELAQEEHVAVGDPGELAEAGPVDVAAEDPPDELAHVRPGERPDLDLAADAVLPEGDDRVGGGLAGCAASRSTQAASVAASWWTSAAEPSSRRWASSTRRASRLPSAWATSDCRAWRRISSRSAIRPVGGGRRWARAPKGMLAAARVATAASAVQPRLSAPASASVASRLLPTPVGPARTTPR